MRRTCHGYPPGGRSHRELLDVLILAVLHDKPLGTRFPSNFVHQTQASAVRDGHEPMLQIMEQDGRDLQDDRLDWAVVNGVNVSVIDDRALLPKPMYSMKGHITVN